MIFLKDSFSENFLCSCLISKKLAILGRLFTNLMIESTKGLPTVEGTFDSQTKPSRFSADSRYRRRTIISRGLYIFTQFFTAVYIVERLIFEEYFLSNLRRTLPLKFVKRFFKKIWYIFDKVHIFWEGHKILRYLHQLFVLCTASQIFGGDFAKFCGLLRIYEL